MNIRLMDKNDSIYLSQMAKWLYDWWGKDEDYNYESIKQYLYYGLNNQGFPYTYGLFEGKQLIGMYQIRLDDLFIRPDLYPWLANVYIDEKYRHLGYGKLLLESVKENAKALSLSYLYLYTYHNHLYEKYGWVYIEEIDTCLLKPRIQKIYQLVIE